MGGRQSRGPGRVTSRYKPLIGQFKRAGGQHTAGGTHNKGGGQRRDGGRGRGRGEIDEQGECLRRADIAGVVDGAPGERLLGRRGNDGGRGAGGPVAARLGHLKAGQPGERVVALQRDGHRRVVPAVGQLVAVDDRFACLGRCAVDTNGGGLSGFLIVCPVEGAIGQRMHAPSLSTTGG